MKGSSDVCQCFTRVGLRLKGSIDADLASAIDSKKSTTCLVYMLDGITLSWCSKLQKIVDLFTIEAKYVVVSEVSKEMIWLQKFLEKLGKKELVSYSLPIIQHLIPELNKFR